MLASLAATSPAAVAFCALAPIIPAATARLADFALALREGLLNGAVKSAGRTASMTDPHEIRSFFESEINRSMKAAQADLSERWANLRDGEASDGADEGVANDEFED